MGRDKSGGMTPRVEENSRMARRPICPERRGGSKERRLTASDLEEVVVADAHNLLPPGKKSGVRSGEKETGVELAC